MGRERGQLRVAIEQALGIAEAQVGEEGRLLASVVGTDRLGAPLHRDARPRPELPPEGPVVLDRVVVEGGLIWERPPGRRLAGAHERPELRRTSQRAFALR